MNQGKNHCDFLKNIRVQIAEENNIPLIIEECTFEGNCKGTCPRCEAELLYLEQKIAEKKQFGKRALVAGISLGVMATFFSCQTEGDIPAPDENFPQDTIRQMETVLKSETLEVSNAKDIENQKNIVNAVSGENVYTWGEIEPLPPLEPFLKVNLNELLPDSLKKIKVEDFIRDTEPSN